MMSITKKAGFYFWVSVFIFIVTTPIRYESRTLDLSVTHIIYFLAVLLSIKYSKVAPKKLLIAFASGFLVLYISVAILEEFSLLFSLNVCSYLLAMFNAYLFGKLSNIVKKIAVLFISAIYCFIAVYFLADFFLHYENHGSFTGRLNKSVPQSGGFVTEHNDTITASQFDPEKILVLDVWSTSCGICFTQFPILESIYSKYKMNEHVIITGMNVKLDRDTVGQAVNVIRNRNYTFPVSVSYNGLDTALQVYAYPVTIVIHDNHIVYRGEIKGVEKVIDELLIK